MPHKKIKQFFKYIVVDLLLAALIAFLLINYVISAVKVEGESMSPLLQDRDRVFISKLGVRRGKIARFDIVVIDAIGGGRKPLVKRVIGMPGEIVEMRQGEVYINYRLLTQGFLGQRPAAGGDTPAFKPLLIPKDHYFVLGDNRGVSRDSRTLGPIPKNRIQGKIFFRYWPLSRLGKVEAE
jgi:signal peptidase I